MLKLGITVWLTVVALLGPRLCCCAHSGPLSPATPTQGPSDSCCRHEGQAPAAPPDSPVAPKCPHGQPCGEVDALPIAGMATGHDSEIVPSGFLLAATALVVGGNASGPHAGQLEPFLVSFLSPRDRLRLLHILRC